ncbi:hypothetical protein Pyn_17940 [Prunus yedoensis var. nudiflora]|uniref:Uncharacterized protein n=1 Tax=Prunus yedoensis var. nudiflora TaxID=2094558 RepID=A0A314YDE5_PRUYE|nr:hypothetical protein Pyn_17940 [Prunus yedoensis var. nudiflora]
MKGPKGVGHKKRSPGDIVSWSTLFVIMNCALFPGFIHLLHFPLSLWGKICGSSDELVNFWECEKKLSHSGFPKVHKLAVCVWQQPGTRCLAAQMINSDIYFKLDSWRFMGFLLKSMLNGQILCVCVKKGSGRRALLEVICNMYFGLFSILVPIISIQFSRIPVVK